MYVSLSSTSFKCYWQYGFKGMPFIRVSITFAGNRPVIANAEVRETAPVSNNFSLLVPTIVDTYSKMLYAHVTLCDRWSNIECPTLEFNSRWPWETFSKYYIST